MTCKGCGYGVKEFDTQSASAMFAEDMNVISLSRNGP